MKTIEVSYENYTIDDMKVFKVDEYQWIASPSLLHALVLFDEQVYLEIDYLKDIEECDIEKEGMWDSTDITDGEKEAFKQGNLKIYDPHDPETFGKTLKRKEPEFGEYGFYAFELCKWTSFADVIKRQDVGTYVIASTEY